MLECGNADRLGAASEENRVPKGVHWGKRLPACYEEVEKGLVLSHIWITGAITPPEPLAHRCQGSGK